MHFFHNYVHSIMYLLGLLLSFSSGCEDYWGGASSSALARRVRRQRHITDPAMWCALGVLLKSHVHDNDLITKYSHAFLGYMFIALAALQCLSAVYTAFSNLSPKSHPNLSHDLDSVACLTAIGLAPAVGRLSVMHRPTAPSRWRFALSTRSLGCYLPCGCCTCE